MSDDDRTDYRGKPFWEMPNLYRGYDGQERWAMAHYSPAACEAIVSAVTAQARERLRAGEDAADVETWLAEQVLASLEDEAARARFGRTAQLHLSRDPKATRADVARRLARAVVYQTRGRTKR